MNAERRAKIYGWIAVAQYPRKVDAQAITDAFRRLRVPWDWDTEQRQGMWCVVVPPGDAKNAMELIYG